MRVVPVAHLCIVATAISVSQAAPLKRSVDAATTDSSSLTTSANKLLPPHTADDVSLTATAGDSFSTIELVVDSPSSSLNDDTDSAERREVYASRRPCNIA
ncbi:hypothetical protein C8R43DRAFT_1228877 [Mycena crocata]|nr:hypothetical protein C8R43DRAFT_1228877 [Mycena crocata]